MISPHLPETFQESRCTDKTRATGLIARRCHSRPSLLRIGRDSTAGPVRPKSRGRRHENRRPTFSSSMPTCQISSRGGLYSSTMRIGRPSGASNLVSGSMPSLW